MFLCMVLQRNDQKLVRADDLEQLSSVGWFVGIVSFASQFSSPPDKQKSGG